MSHRWGRGIILAAGIAVAAGGCRSSSRRPEPALLAPSEPTLGDPVESGPSIPSGPSVSTTPAVGWTERHPLFTKPKEWYDTTDSDNRFVRAASATFIGVPAGILGELRQIVTGAPPTVRY